MVGDCNDLQIERRMSQAQQTRKTMQLTKEPSVHADVWTAFNDAKNARKTHLLGAVFGLNDDESEIVLVGTVKLSDAAPWQALQALFPAQATRWALLTLPFKTVSGGERSKLVYVNWVPDTLERASHKATIQAKSNALTFGAPLAAQATTDGAVMHQANSIDDLLVDAILTRASAREVESVDRDSVERFRGSSLVSISEVTESNL
jgi:hypothetical protein